MVYFQDLSPYAYWWSDDPISGAYESPRPLNIGWLDAAYDFNRGSVDDKLLEKLLALCCVHRCNVMRGYHSSPFIPDPPFGYAVTHRGKEYLLGSAEIRVRGKEGRVYAAPNLIYHYMKDTGYLPPEEFLQGLRDMPVDGI